MTKKSTSQRTYETDTQGADNICTMCYTVQKGHRAARCQDPECDGELVLVDRLHNEPAPLEPETLDLLRQLARRLDAARIGPRATPGLRKVMTVVLTGEPVTIRYEDAVSIQKYLQHHYHIPPGDDTIRWWRELEEAAK